MSARGEAARPERAPLSQMARGLQASLREWETHALIDRWLYRPIDQAIVRVLLPTRVTPNHVSVASAIAGLVSAFCYLHFSAASIAAGGLLLMLSVVFDGVDGQLARARGTCSETGKLFDNIADPAKTVFVMFGIGLGMDRLDTMGSFDILPVLSLDARIYGLGILTGGSILVQVMLRNHFVERYRRLGKGRSDPNVAKLDRVRAEIAAMRAAGGHRLERAVAGLILFFAALAPERKPVPAPRIEAVPGYERAMLPLVRCWTFYGGGTQFTVLVFASLFGEPLLGWLYISIVANVLLLPLLLATLVRDRRLSRATTAQP